MALKWGRSIVNPTDSIEMKHIENTCPNKFKDEVCNLWLSISIDGVNPYSQPNNTYTIWNVVVINNNIPPWLSMKNENLMLALIVPSRRQVKNIDVYLQLFIDEFKELWEWIQVYDVSRLIPSKKSFMLYGIYSYTAHDYLGLGFFSCKCVVWYVFIQSNNFLHL